MIQFCSPYHQNSALYPAIDHLQRAAGFDRDDQDEQKLDKLQRLLSQSTDSPERDVPLFASLLSLPTGASYPPLELAPEERKARTLEALVAQVDALARRQPVFQLFEDVHWIDPTSLELLGLLIQRVRTAPALLVITSRPEFKPPWPVQPHVSTLSLNRLSRRQGAAMVEQVAAGKGLPPEVQRQIVANTDGVPLFVEELTKSVLESGLLREEGDHYALLGDLPPLAIPATLQDSLTARLDRLIPVKDVAQIGAAIGRDFSYELLALVAPLRTNELHEALARLEESELVYRQGTPPQATFTFKHALVKDAAYDSMLRSKRQQTHAAIARAIEEHFAETTLVQPEVVAHHYTEAGLAMPASGYWLKAGRRSIERSANVEAIRQLSRGLELLAGEPDSRSRAELELALQISLAIPSIAVRGYAAPETARAYTRARELCDVLGDTEQLFPALYGEWLHLLIGRGLHDEARGVALEFLDLARQHGDRGGAVVAHRVLGLTLFSAGQLAAAREQMEEVARLYEPEAHRTLAFRYGQDPRAAALTFRAWTEWALGYPETALRHSREAIALARDLGHATTMGYALSTAPYVHWFCGDMDGAARAAEEAASFSSEQRLPFWRAMARIVSGRVAVEHGQVEHGLAEIRAGLADSTATGTVWLRPVYLGSLAEALLSLDRAEQGLEAVEDALATAGPNGEQFYAAELHRLRAELLLRLSPSQNEADIEGACQQALLVARAQGARSLELRAATTLGRHWRRRGNGAKARDLMAPIYAWFTEGHATRDLLAAESLLESLA